MNTNGFIQLSREFITWQWYDDDSAMRLFLHLLLTANYASVKWHGITVERGQRVITLNTLAEETGLSKTTVIKTLRKLQKSGDIEQCATSRFTVVRVKNYDDFTKGVPPDDREETAGEPSGDSSKTAHYYNKNNKYNKNNNYNNTRNTELKDSIDISALERASYERYRKAAAQRAENG